MNAEMQHECPSVHMTVRQAPPCARCSITPSARTHGADRARSASVCDAYGIARAAGGRRDDAPRRRQQLASSIGFPGGPEDRLAATSCTRPRPAACLSASRPPSRSPQGLRHDRRQRPEIRRQGGDHRRAGAADAAAAARKSSSAPSPIRLRQAGRLRPGRHAGRGAEGHHLPAGAGLARGRALDARRHRGGGDPERRARRQGGRPRGAGRP